MSVTFGIPQARGASERKRFEAKYCIPVRKAMSAHLIRGDVLRVTAVLCKYTLSPGIRGFARVVKILNVQLDLSE